MTSANPDHKLAQALDLARREAQLTTAQLAQALSFNPRTVRRYLNGERRPERDTVVRWEQVCGATPGTLIALYASSPASEISPPPSRARSPLPSVLAAVAVMVALGLVVLLRGGDEPNSGDAARPRPTGDAARPRPTGVAYHSFTASYVGDVWIRISPTHEHSGERHRVTLHWGSLMQQVDLPNLDRSRTLFTGKNRPDHVSMRVNVSPAASIAFGESNVPAGAQDIKPGWKTTR